MAPPASSSPTRKPPMTLPVGLSTPIAPAKPPTGGGRTSSARTACLGVVARDGLRRRASPSYIFRLDLDFRLGGRHTCSACPGRESPCRPWLAHIGGPVMRRPGPRHLFGRENPEVATCGFREPPCKGYGDG